MDADRAVERISGGMAALLSAIGIDADKWAHPLEVACSLYDITERRKPMFLAQCAHESEGFTELVENLDYSADALLRTWPKRFSPTQAKDYERQPERIANRVYSFRMGNGDEATGDGWKYRGRGLIQITGRGTYLQCGLAVSADLINEPDLLSDDPLRAALSAAWFWSTHGCNELADDGDYAAITRQINGGLTGYADRVAWLRKVNRALA